MITLAVITAWIPAPARADGDPASDVLASQPLFLPGDGGIPPRQQADLSRLIQAANRGGYGLRVAVIATPADLGSVGELWRRPNGYAHFLGLELALVYRGATLIAMPNGFGLYARHSLSAAERAALAAPTAPGTGARLGASTINAIQRLAAAAGHPLPAPNEQHTTAPHTHETAAWIAYPAGALIILLAWAASLRTQPPRARRSARIPS